jgi:hypothetical protein
MIAVNTIHTFVLLRDGNLIFWFRERERRRGVGEDYPLPPLIDSGAVFVFLESQMHITPLSFEN